MSRLVTKIHELRRARKMQQTELANIVGVRRETIGNLENGKYNPSLKLAMDIAKVFGKPVEEVFQFVEDDEEQNKGGSVAADNSQGHCGGPVFVCTKWYCFSFLSEQNEKLFFLIFAWYNKFKVLP